MAKRTTYLKVSHDDSRVVSGAWAWPSKTNKEVANHIVFGSEGTDSEPPQLALARYDGTVDELCAPKFKLPVEEGLRPGKMAVHPGGDGVIVSFETGCKLFSWGEPVRAKTKSKKEVELKLELSEAVLSDLENVGPQNCLLFNGDGSILASGGEDGCIRVFRWPSMAAVLNLPKAYKSIKDLDFSLDSAFLSATADHSPCRIWDLSSSENVATLEPKQGESFGFSRFSRNGKKAFLFISLTKEKRGYVGVWGMVNWSRIGAKKFLSEPITSFAITHHGRRLAMGTQGGDISIIEIEKMQVQQIVKNAHTKGITFLEFSPDNKSLLSLSSDCSSRVSALDLSKEWKEWQVILVLVALIVASIPLFYCLHAYGENFFQLPAGQRQGANPQIENPVTDASKHEEL